MYMHCIYLQYRTGTEVVMENTLNSSVEKEFISLSWIKPKYTPVEISVSSQCSLLCERKPYLEQQWSVPVDQTQLKISKLKPGTICRIHILVTYNPSRLDRGNNYEYKTLQAGELQKACAQKVNFR